MKRVVLAGLLSLVAISAAFAAPRGINISNDVRAKISADVAKQTPATQAKYTWRRGRKIDDGVALQDVPAAWGKDMTKYKYFYTGNQVWFIDPATRRAMDVIKVTR